MKPEKWKNSNNKLFPYQVGFTGPPHDFDAAPSDFLRISPQTVGVHGRMLHVPEYNHRLDQRFDNFQLLEEFVECMSNNGVDVCGQVGTNWVHAGGKTPKDIQQFCEQVSDKYETPLHMAGMCLVEGLLELNVEKIALNSVYYWTDWRDGIARFLKQAGFDLLYCGNFVDQGYYSTQQEVNELSWIFPGDLAEKSMQYVMEQAPTAEAIVVNGMPNFRNSKGLPERMVSIEVELESKTGKPIVSSDTALYWRIFKTIGISPSGNHGKLLSTLVQNKTGNE